MGMPRTCGLGPANITTQKAEGPTRAYSLDMAGSSEHVGENQEARLPGQVAQEFEVQARIGTWAEQWWECPLVCPRRVVSSRHRHFNLGELGPAAYPPRRCRSLHHRLPTRSITSTCGSGSIRVLYIAAVSPVTRQESRPQTPARAPTPRAPSPQPPRSPH
jgi:hypothetical protein